AVEPPDRRSRAATKALLRMGGRVERAHGFAGSPNAIRLAGSNVGVAHAYVDIEKVLARSVGLASEIETLNTRCFVLEVVRARLVRAHEVDRAAKVDRSLPAQVRALVLAMSDPQFPTRPCAAAARSPAVEVQPVAVGTEVWSEILDRAVHDVSKIDRVTPA